MYNCVVACRWSCSLKRDMKSIMPVKCDHCNYRTKTGKAMRIHIARDHNEKVVIWILRDIIRIISIVKRYSVIDTLIVLLQQIFTLWKTCHVIFEIHCCKKFECECGLKFGSKQVYSRHVRLKCKLKKNIGKTTKDLLQQCDKCPSKVLSLEEHHVSKINRGIVRAAIRVSLVGRIVGKLGYWAHYF